MADVAVIFGGPSPEHDVSVLTGLQAARELATSGAVRAIYWSKTGDWYEVPAGLEAEAFLDGVPRGAQALRLAAVDGFSAEGGRLGRARPLDLEAAVVCCHGGPGEDGTLQGLLDLAGVAYAGPTVAGAAVGMDKLAFAALAASAGLPTLPRVLLGPESDDVGFDGPYIVKPRFGGSSIGIQVVADLPTATAQLSLNRHLARGAVLEPYRKDFFDLQVAVRSWPELQLSAIERPLRADGPAGGHAEILGYADKYVAGEGMAGARRELPAKLGAELEERIRRAAEVVARLTELRGVARIDFLSDGEDLVVNEVNTVPGSLARYLWIEPPLAFSRLLADLLVEATARPTHAYSSAGADGSVLRSAGSIAAKLA